MAADVYDDDGRPVRGQVGELVVTRPWPGMTAGFWKDRSATSRPTGSRWPDVWVHGDWAYIDPDGFWFIQGRSDDTLKIAGQAGGAGRAVESVLVGHPAVAEAAAIGVPQPRSKGESRGVLRGLRPDQPGVRGAPRRAHRRSGALDGEGDPAGAGALRARAAQTRSAKIMRRVVRATYLGKDPGDLSSLDNPGGVKAIARRALRS